MKVLESLKPLGLNVVRAENHVYVFFLLPFSFPTPAHSLFRNKAVSDGAISFYLDHYVRTRVSKVTYGNFCHIPYDSSDPEHVRRQGNMFMDVSGAKRISNTFDIILPKVCGLVVCYISWRKEADCNCVWGGDFRIPKCQKRKSLGNLIFVNRRIGTSLRMRHFRFGVIVGLWRSLGGRTLILVPSLHPSSFSSS